MVRSGDLGKEAALRSGGLDTDEDQLVEAIKSKEGGWELLKKESEFKDDRSFFSSFIPCKFKVYSVLI